MSYKDLQVVTYLFMPLQQHSTAVVGWALKAFINILHQQVHTILVQRLNGLLNIISFKRDEHFQDNAACPVLRVNT